MVDDLLNRIEKLPIEIQTLIINQLPNNKFIQFYYRYNRYKEYVGKSYFHKRKRAVISDIFKALRYREWKYVLYYCNLKSNKELIENFDANDISDIIIKMPNINDQIIAINIMKLNKHKFFYTSLNNLLLYHDYKMLTYLLNSIGHIDYTLINYNILFTIIKSQINSINVIGLQFIFNNIININSFIIIYGNDFFSLLERLQYTNVECLQYLISKINYYICEKNILFYVNSIFTQYKYIDAESYLDLYEKSFIIKNLKIPSDILSALILINIHKNKK